MKASIILSNYQGMKFLPKCLNHLNNQTYSNYEIILVDAGSNDGSPDFVKSNYPNIKVIRCGRIGIGEAANIGIKNADGKIIIFDLNTDEYVEPNWLEEIVSHLEKNKFQIVAGHVRIIFNTDRIDEAGVKVDFLGRAKKLGHMVPQEQYRFQNEPVDFTGAPAFHRNILEKIGPIDESYFIYAEDHDFCYRAKLVGFDTIICSRARSSHHIRGTLGTSSRRLEYYLRRANLRFNCLYSSLPKLCATAFYMALFLPTTALLMSLTGTKSSTMYKEKFIGRLRAVLWNLKNFNDTLHFRYRANRLKRLNTRY